MGPRTGRPLPDSTLLRVGFAEPAGSPRPLVRSYRTVSPLPVRRPGVTPSAVCSLWHFPAGRPDWPLASTLPCGVPTFLGSFPTGGVAPRLVVPRPPGRLTVPPIVAHTAGFRPHFAARSPPTPAIRMSSGPTLAPSLRPAGRIGVPSAEGLERGRRDAGETGPAPCRASRCAGLNHRRRPGCDPELGLAGQLQGLR